MIPLVELREQVLASTAQSFATQFGRIALVQSPPEPMLRRAAIIVATSQTLGVSNSANVGQRLMGLLGGFEGLSVEFLKPTRHGATFTVGRNPGSDVLISDPSVSKRHATLRWDAARGGCTVRDEGSKNGTFAGSARLGKEEQVLMDGDALAFGEAQFLYVLTETLYEQLRMSRFGYG